MVRELDQRNSLLHSGQMDYNHHVKHPEKNSDVF